MCKKLNYLLFFVLMLVLTGSLAAQDPGTENLTHLWTFEDGSADDLIGEAHGELIGVNVFVDAGDLVTVPNSDNVADSHVELPGDEIDLATYDEVSVVAWYTSDVDNVQWNTLWYFGDDGAGAGVGSNGFCLQPCRGDNVARVWISCGNESAPYSTEDAVNDTTGFAATGQNTEYADGELHHTVCMLNDVPEIVMYHNGVLLGATPLESDEATGKDNAIWNISPNFGRFCHSCYYADIPWLGSIHDIAIFNKALSEEEVTYLFENEGWANGITAVDNAVAALPSEYGLAQNYPNPFNPTTSISFDLPNTSNVNLVVYDVLGQEVVTLVDGVKSAGRHSVQFDGTNLNSGMYFYQLKTSDQIITKKMLLAK